MCECSELSMLERPLLDYKREMGCGDSSDYQQYRINFIQLKAQEIVLLLLGNIIYSDCFYAILFVII